MSYVSSIALFCLMSLIASDQRTTRTPQDFSDTAFVSAVAFCFDLSNNLYVLDEGQNIVFKFSNEGKLIRTAGGYGWSNVEFDHPKDISSPNDLDIYISDYGNHRIVRIDRNLNFIFELPSPDEQLPSERLFGYPYSIAVDGIGELFIVDKENNRIVKVGTSNEIERTFGGIDAGKGSLYNPSRIRVSERNLVYVQDGNRLVIFDRFGNYSRSIGDGMFHHLRTFCIADSSIYVLDSCIIRKIDESSLGSRPLEEYILSDECSTAVDIAVHDENIYILTREKLFKHHADELKKPHHDE